MCPCDTIIGISGAPSPKPWTGQISVRFGFHDLRHTFRASRRAMRWRQRPHTLMALGGWKCSPPVLDRYAHLCTGAFLWQAITKGLAIQVRIGSKTGSEGEPSGRNQIEVSEKDWAGNGFETPRPSPWQGDALPLSLFPPRSTVGQRGGNLY